MSDPPPRRQEAGAAGSGTASHFRFFFRGNGLADREFNSLTHADLLSFLCFLLPFLFSPGSPQPKLLSRELLDLVASHFNLKEKEYFGLCFVDDK